MKLNLCTFVCSQTVSLQNFLTPYAKKAISQMKEVQRCDRITGDDCLCILSHFNNNKHLIAFLEEISKYGTSKTSIILEN